jgi:hypothetical protein
VTAPPTCVIPFRNVGVSTAIIDHVRANSTGEWVEGTFSHHALPPAEEGRAAFTLPEVAQQFLAVEIAYTDIAGEQATRTRLTLVEDDMGGWRIKGVALYNGPDGRPRARTGDLFPGSMGQEYRRETERRRLFGDN